MRNDLYDLRDELKSSIDFLKNSETIKTRTVGSWRTQVEMLEKRLKSIESEIDEENRWIDLMAERFDTAGY